MQNYKKIMLMSAAATVLAFSGCASWDHKNPDRSMGRVIDDKNITAHVQTSLHEEPVYKFGDVDVKTFNGVVQLSGFVNADEQKRRAGEIAQRVEGVQQVINNIALKQGVPTATGRSEAQIRGNYNENTTGRTDAQIRGNYNENNTSSTNYNGRIEAPTTSPNNTPK